MSSHSGETTGLSQAARGVLRGNQAAADALPDPRERFTRDEVAPELDHVFESFVSHGIVHQAARRDGRAVWTTSLPAYRFASRYCEPAWVLPCGHGGLVNIRGDYTCGEPTCGAEFDRGTVEAALAQEADY